MKCRSSMWLSSICNKTFNNESCLDKIIYFFQPSVLFDSRDISYQKYNND